jgi:hypothetical protein
MHFEENGSLAYCLCLGSPHVLLALTRTKFGSLPILLDNARLRYFSAPLPNRPNLGVIGRLHDLLSPLPQDVVPLKTIPNTTSYQRLQSKYPSNVRDFAYL